MIHPWKKWKYFLLITIFWSFFYALYHTKKLYSTKNVSKRASEKVSEELSGNVTCYYYEDGTNFLQEFDDLEPIMGTDIFFHDTSCPDNISDIHLSAKQACSIESATLAYPTSYVFLLIPSPIKVNHPHTRNIFVKKLLDYPNFLIRHINFTRYLQNTPFQKILDSKSLYTSKWPVAHASDVLRFVSLYRFGGSYLDPDVIVLKPLTNISNYAGVESDNIGSGVLNFGSDKVGRDVAKDCAEELSSTFNGSIWDYNGPGIITRLLKKRCNVTEITDMIDKTCEKFHIYKELSFTPISYMRRRLIYENGKWEEIQKLISESFMVRTWNSTLNGLNEENIPYLKLAEKYCPKIFGSGTLISSDF